MDHPGRLQHLALGLALGVSMGVLATAGLVQAQSALRALDAVWLTPRVREPVDSVRLAASGEYGMSLAAAREGEYQRGVGGLAAALTSRTGVGLELRVDGRWDRHGAPRRDDSFTGEPRLYVRYGRGLTPRFSAGAELAVWVPGADAPSLAWRATSADLLAVCDLSLPLGFSLVWALGPRLDRSARSVSFPRGFEYSESDMLALGVSSYHALLSRLALEYTRAAQRLGLEFSADTLLGKGAPPWVATPLRAALVASTALGRRGELFAALGVRLSRTPRPSIPGDYRPFEPRLMGMVGIRVQLARSRSTPTKGTVAPPPQAASVSVLALDEAQRPLPDVIVLLDARERHTDARGGARFEAVEPGEHRVALRAVGFADWSDTVRVEAATAAQLRIQLAAQATDGLLQVLVRDVGSSEPLAAQLTLRRMDLRRGAGAVPHAIEVTYEGRWKGDLTPGTYTLGVLAPGHAPQSLSFEIRPGGVTQFNVDLVPAESVDALRP
ncbi:MAG: carboxypeptidase-like regulatory domain-containing protein [Myxococcales bacterium]